MATKYEGIVIELGADTSDLQSAMRQVNSAASKTQKELNQIKTALKFNPGNMTLLAQQTGQLSNEVEQTKGRLKVLRSQLQAMSQDQSKIGTDEWDKLQREIIQTESKLESYEAQLKQAERAQQSASTSLGQLSAKMQANADRFRDIGSSIRNVGVGMTAGLTVPLVAAGSQAVSTAATFDDAMSQVSGALGDAGADMDGLRTLALQLGADTVFSATEAGQAMVELAKGGLTEADIKSGALEASMNLAAAGGLELATAANATVQSMGAFGLAAGDASVIANALAGSANASSADVADLTQAMSQCSAQANLVGWDIQDTAAVLGMFADAGIQGSDAGTSLKTMLQRLAAPTDKAADAVAELGLQVRDQDGHMRSASEIAAELQTKLGGLSDAQRDAAMQTIFGSDASRAAAVMMTQGADGLAKYTEATHDATAAETMAAAQKGELSWAMENMEGAIESASIALGTALAPAIQAVAGFVGDLATWFSELDPSMQTVVAVALALVAALGPILTIVGMIIMALPGLTAGLSMVAGAISLPLAPIAAVVAAVGAVIAIIVYLWNTNSEFQAAVMNIWTEIQNLFATVMPIIQQIFEVVWPTIQAIVTGVLDTILAVVGTVFTAIADQISTILAMVTGVIQGAWDVISGIFQTVLGLIVGIVTGDFSMMQDGISSILNGITGIVTSVWNGIASTITNVVNTIASVVSDVFNGVSNTVGSIFGSIADTIGNAIGDAKNVVSDGLNAIANFFSGLHLEFPKFTLPHFTVSGSFSLNPPSIPTFGVEWYAKGGIINKPSVIGVGEAGAEAVMPLAKLPELMAEALQMVRGGSGGGTVIVQNMTVGKESDIRGVAQELYRLGQRAARVEGTVYA